MSLDAGLKVVKISRETIMKRRAPAIGREELAAEIASLSKLDIDELRERWKAMFGKRAVARYQPVVPDARHRISPPGKSFRRTQALDAAPAGRVRL